MKEPLITPSKMTNREFFDTMIKPKLVAMAIDCTLPSDMNELYFELFEDEEDDSETLTRLGTLVSEDPEEQLTILKAYIDPENRADADFDQLAEYIDIAMTEAAEYAYTVRGLCDAIGLPIQPTP
jgi:hypothetical protein